MTNIISSNIPYYSSEKNLIPFGVSISNYADANIAKGYTYTTRDGQFPSTPIFSEFNVFSEEIKKSTNVIEIGCGVGRNLPIIMEQTNAHYYGVDPNELMHKYFWDLQDIKYKDRVTLCKSFDEIPHNIKADFVLVTFVYQHIGFRPPIDQMNVVDISLEAMKHTKDGAIWFVLEHEREEHWQERWLNILGITPDIYFKPGGNYAGGGYIPYPEFESMTHRGNDNNLIIFRENKSNVTQIEQL